MRCEWARSSGGRWRREGGTVPHHSPARLSPPPPTPPHVSSPPGRRSVAAPCAASGHEAVGGAGEERAPAPARQQGVLQPLHLPQKEIRGDPPEMAPIFSHPRPAVLGPNAAGGGGRGRGRSRRKIFSEKQRRRNNRRQHQHGQGNGQRNGQRKPSLWLGAQAGGQQHEGREKGSERAGANDVRTPVTGGV
ncbi:unnamed protein product [Closterium sp. NIES-54]